MRDALPPTPAGLARWGFTCQACGHTIVTAVDELFTNPPAAADSDSAAPPAAKPPTAAAKPAPPRTHPDNTPAAAPGD